MKKRRPYAQQKMLDEIRRRTAMLMADIREAAGAGDRQRAGRLSVKLNELGKVARRLEGMAPKAQAAPGGLFNGTR